MALSQGWFYRHLIFSDGTSYLDIAANYARGNWRAALNEYWSPLVPWILAVVMKIFHPSPYWQAAAQHFVNLGLFCLSLAALELFLAELARRAGRSAASELTLRIAGYTGLFWAGLHLIGVYECSPDMLAMLLLFVISFLLLRISRGAAGSGTYVAFGVLLGLGFLSRAAFLPLVAIYVAVVCAMLWRGGRHFIVPAALICASALLVMGPFVAALSVAKGRFTLGATGRLNYAWEICGAPLYIHWQGEPYDIGTPQHPTRKISVKPAAYTFVGPVPGAYPLWYEPSYWYAGVAPHLELGPQLRVLFRSNEYLAVLLLLEAPPVAIPALLLVFLSGWRRWLSRRGIAAYWFLLIPIAVYIELHCLVFLDRRYIAAALVIVWLCLLASLPAGGVSAAVRRWFNAGIQVLCGLFCIVFIAMRLAGPAGWAARDLVHRTEDEWNLEWMIAERLRDLGVGPGDRVAYIGDSMNADWVRLVNAQIVAEVPTTWYRPKHMPWSIMADRSGVRQFWEAAPEVRERILDEFRRVDATLVVADKVPPEATRDGWQTVLRPGTPHLPRSDEQMDYKTTAFLPLTTERAGLPRR